MDMADESGPRAGAPTLGLSERLFLHDFDIGLDPTLDLVLTQYFLYCRGDLFNGVQPLARLPDALAQLLECLVCGLNALLAHLAIQRLFLRAPDPKDAESL